MVAWKISGAGRGLLIFGAALLLLSLLGPVFDSSLPLSTWFTISGSRPDLPAGPYTGLQITRLLNQWAAGPYAWFAFGWLTVCAAAALAISGIGERIRNFGTSGILALLLYAVFLFLAAYQSNQQAPGGNAAISVGYGFVLAVVSCVLIEAGARLPGAVPMRRHAPAAGSGQEKPPSP
jgi:uncharacterized membrane protein (DUF485 family)